jgi:hypothetical protein
MAKKHLPLASFTDADSPRMRQAIAALLKQKFPVTRPSQYQLKIGGLNFYPDKGTIFPDGGEALEVRGLNALLDRLRATRSRRDKARSTSAPAAPSDHPGGEIDLGLTFEN